MKDTSGFTVCEAQKPPIEIPLEEGEEVIGWYRNPPPWEGSVLLFTSKAIWTAEGSRTERIALRDIADYESPETTVDVTGMRVRTRDGFRFMRIAGSYGPSGKYKDFLALMMVLRAVINSDAGS